jgi:hypothetical protein
MAWLLVAGAALADGKQQVRPSATVEVLDERAQIDDVISRLKSEPAPPATAQELRAERLPPPPPTESELKRTNKNQTTRRVHRERLEHTTHKH